MLTLYVLAVGAGLLVGRLLGGRLRHALNVPLRWSWLLAVALALQLSLALMAPSRRGPEATAAFVSSFALIVVWLALNALRLSRPLQIAVGTVGVGAAMNGIVIAANGRMPVSASAVRSAGIPRVPRILTRHVITTRSASLGWLGDVVAVRPLRIVVSAGDVVLLVGLCGCAAVATRTPT